MSSLNAPAQDSTAAREEARKLYAVEFKTGPKWDREKKPQEQAYFKEHSANLQRLRAKGVLVMGARYADKGLIVLVAVSEAEARAMIETDHSVQNGTFVFELSELKVFYPGHVGADR